MFKNIHCNHDEKYIDTLRSGSLFINTKTKKECIHLKFHYPIQKPNYDNTAATAETGEILGDCLAAPGAVTVWFTFTAPASGFVNLSTNFAGGGNGDTQLTVFSGTPCPGANFGALTQIACNDDADFGGGNYLAEIPAATVNPSEVYYVQVTGWNNTMGTFCLEITAIDDPCVVNGTCDTAGGETFCNCSDCGTLCSSAAATFLDYNPVALSASPVAYCESTISTTPNPDPAAVYVPIAPVNVALPDDLACVTWDLTTTGGSLYSSTSTIEPTTSIENGFIFFLRMTDAEIAASGGTTTVTFTASGTPTPCTFTYAVDWNGTILQDDGTAWAGSAAAQCGCISPTATVEYNCATSSLVVNVTDAGVSTSAFVIDVPGTGLPTQTIGATVPMDYSFGPLPQDSTFSVTISDGVEACDLAASPIYPGCRELMAGCTELLIDGGLDSIPTENWVEYTDTTGIVITPAGNINAWNSRLLGAGSAWLGGWGSATRTSTTSISQTVTIPTGTASLYFWVYLPVCDSVDDAFTLSVDGGTAIPILNGGAAQCGTNTWIEYSVNLDAYADGGSHTITLQLTEDGKAGGNTNLFLDEISLESCATGCDVTLYVPGPINSGVYEAEQNVNSDGAITALPVQTVIFQAGVDINLNPDFCVPAGSDFTARIAPCGTPARLSAGKKGKLAKFSKTCNLMSQHAPVHKTKVSVVGTKSGQQLSTSKSVQPMNQKH